MRRHSTTNSRKKWKVDQKDNQNDWNVFEKGQTIDIHTVWQEVTDRSWKWCTNESCTWSWGLPLWLYMLYFYYYYYYYYQCRPPWIHILQATSILNVTFMFNQNESHDCYTVVSKCCTKISQWQCYNEYCTIEQIKMLQYWCTKVTMLKYVDCCCFIHLFCLGFGYGFDMSSSHTRMW